MKHSVPKLARREGVAPKKILTWINSGELRAVNLATVPGGRPRWAIDEEDWQVFEKSRQAIPESKPVRRRKATTIDGGKDFFAHIPG